MAFYEQTLSVVAWPEIFETSAAQAVHSRCGAMNWRQEFGELSVAQVEGLLRRPGCDATRAERAALSGLGAKRVARGEPKHRR